MSTMEYFGEAYPSDLNPAPIYLGMKQVVVPVGEACLYCDEPIVEDDRGFIQSAFIRRNNEGELIPTREPIHHECNLRMAIGSVKHQRGECGCATGDFTQDDDAPFATRHEAALAALAEFERQNGKWEPHKPTKTKTYDTHEGASTLGAHHARQRHQQGVKIRPKYKLSEWRYALAAYPAYEAAYRKEEQRFKENAEIIEKRRRSAYDDPDRAASLGRAQVAHLRDDKNERWPYSLKTWPYAPGSYAAYREAFDEALSFRRKQEAQDPNATTPQGAQIKSSNKKYPHMFSKDEEAAVLGRIHATTGRGDHWSDTTWPYSPHTWKAYWTAYSETRARMREEAAEA